jgi:hypothetical protein
VGGEAVGLDHETGVGPGEIDFAALDPGVDLGPRKVVAIHHLEEALLELGTGELGWAPSGPEELGPAPPWIVMNDGYEGGQVEQAQVLGFIDCALQGCGGITSARSSRVRATVVTGMRSWTVTSLAASRPERCTRRPLRFTRPARLGTATST